ncbi:hypothetical protein SAMN05216351_10586 [Pseudobutyrivibrio sp. JW11]|uniref:hypothetical protein n=1 Tax=Pseudobutyrivibrio sp. JW11 TaxID=1855302 RepID=UPI0008E07575|nr:hypothetical protein [Pseudobutyrivibrio sp. JW11]SFO26021.1 hypothetical protein SAMN05216351_10586 [Pseudobutyrivibrio sp. JW11]
MKKSLVALMCAGALSASLFVGCGSTDEAATEQTQATETTESTTEEAAPAAVAAEGELLTGIGTSVAIDSSADATADADGTAQVDATIAAVTVDSNGAIVECVIDIAQTKIGISADGKITSDLDAEYPSKRELGDDYGMKVASAIGKEWYEQADAFAAWAVGKTASDISNMAITEGKAGDEDLAASVSIHVTGFQAAVLEAMDTAVAGGAVAGDKLGLGLTTNIAKSTDATADADGVAEAYTTISVLTVNGDGVITSSLIDAVQAKVTFDANGAITADTSADVPSKNELGDAYGMKAASSIGKEWNEQAAAYAEYTVGKTVDEVNGTAVEEGRATDADLAASVSVHITDFNTAITKAVASAQ